MPPASPAAYGLLGLLATRSWTGYELTQQVRRSLHFVWPVSEGHLYREQRYLVDRGWVSISVEPAGRRTRKRYSITDEGRAALRTWLATPPEEPHLQIEGVLRAFYADRGTPEDLVAALESTAAQARESLQALGGFIDEYLSPGGPLTMLEQGIGGPGDERLEFRGRPMFPERLHAVAVALDITTALLRTIDEACTQTAIDVESWPSTTDDSLTEATRVRLERAAHRM